MDIEQMKIVVKEIITKTDLTPCVVGHRGVGKSEECWLDEERLRQVVECIRVENSNRLEIEVPYRIEVQGNTF